jgi:tetratricopeptide (TPR) repeat protein
VRTLLLAAVLAFAQQPGEARARAWAACTGPTPAAAVAACTGLIDAGDLTKEEHAHALELRGLAKGRLGQYQEAIADLTRALAIDPDRPFALYMRAGVYVSTRQFDKAINDLSRAEALEPDNPAHPRGLANALAATGDLKGSITAANRAIELMPTYAPAYAQRGVAKAAAKDTKGALEDLDRAIQMDPRVAVFLLDRGRVKSDAGDYFGAIKDFERAMALAPAKGSGLADRGVVRLRMKDYQGAIDDLEKAIAITPTHHGAIASLSEARAGLGDLEGALRECAPERLRALAVAPLYRVCAAHLGRAGRIDEAMATYSTAIELEPKNASSYHFRGIFKSDRHDFAGALADFRTAIGLDGTRDYTLLRIFLIESRLGNRTAATVELRDAIARRTAEKADNWIMTIAGHLIGTTSETELMKAADSDVATKTQDRRCEAFFYSGWLRLVNGDIDGARTRFEQSVATGSPTMLELRSAAAELEFMRKR